MGSQSIGTGVGVLVFKDGKFILLKRRGSHGTGTWAPPGGHIEFGESFEDTARRETLEETGMNITNVRVAGVTNDYFEREGKHYVTAWVVSDWEAGEATILEHEKCQEQRWVSVDDLPDELFISLKNFIDSPFFLSAARV